jgi:hypothetical protein
MACSTTFYSVKSEIHIVRSVNRHIDLWELICRGRISR